MENAAAILADHPVNRERLAAGKLAANALWPWGQGRAPSMPTLKEKFGLTGAMISAVDLLKGLGVCAGLEPLSIPGVTGYLDTNYTGKVDAALHALETGDLVYVHIEAPDETSHEGSLEKKLEAIEAFDARVIGPLVKGAEKFSRVRLMVVTDHLTPIKVRTHVADPVPFLIVADLSAPDSVGAAAARFCERNASQTGLELPSGVELFESFLGLKSQDHLMPVHAPIRVTYGDTDAMGQAYYGNYLKWFEIGRSEWFRVSGMTYREVECGGLYLPVVEAHCSYRKPAFYDDLLTIATTFRFSGPARLRFDYEILRQEETLAVGYTVHACVSRERKVLKPPDFLKAVLEPRQET